RWIYCQNLAQSTITVWKLSGPSGRQGHDDHIGVIHDGEPIISRYSNCVIKSRHWAVTLTLLIIARDVGIVCAAGYLSFLSLPE
ncbi:hypothetical protein X801_10724, partial [Opisthorchis viverrini]